jgi:hypothetical protein
MAQTDMARDHFKGRHGEFVDGVRVGPPQTMRADDEDNFTFDLDGFHVVMDEGELTIDNCGYENNPDDPTYALVRAVWRNDRTA